MITLDMTEANRGATATHPSGANGCVWRQAQVIACVLALAAATAMGQDEAPKPELRLEPVVVTATRTTLSKEEPAASATVLDEHAVETSANIAVDDILRTIPGFSLYRRSSSIVTPPDLDPEAQGVTLRNIGPAGASRALVMVDGVPVIGGFDGQVYWGKIPKDTIDHIEIVRGSGATLWGNYAMAGVINIITRKPTDNGVSLKGTYGTDGLTDDYLAVSGHQDRLTVGLDASFFNLNGFPVVAIDQRGPIDGDAGSRDEVVNGHVGYQLSDNASVTWHGQFFDQGANYGTKDRRAVTTSGLLDVTGNLRTDDGSEWQAMLFTNNQAYHIQFSEANEARTTESVTLKQSVPYTDIGASLLWSRRMLGPLLLTSGADLHWIDGQSRDKLYDPDLGPLGGVRSDGKQFFTGFFVESIYTPLPQLEVSFGSRVDMWTNYEGSQNGMLMDPDLGAVALNRHFQNHTYAALNPRMSILYRTTEWLHLRAAAYRGFRAPTLAELYRQSQVEDLMILPNPGLSPERLNGAEVGVDLPVLENFDLRATGFWNEVDNPIVTVDVDPSVCDMALTGAHAGAGAQEEEGGATCRRRFNEGLARSFGAEVETIYEVIPHLFLSGSYLFNDATLVHAAPADKDLEGYTLAQIPPHTFTVAAEYNNPRIITARLEGRFVDDQFEDQEHFDKQGSYFIMNATVGRRLPFWNGEVFIAAENLADRTYVVDHGGGITQTGTPLLIHGGVRFSL